MNLFRWNIVIAIAFISIALSAQLSEACQVAPCPGWGTPPSQPYQPPKREPAAPIDSTSSLYFTGWDEIIDVQELVDIGEADVYGYEEFCYQGNSLSVITKMWSWHEEGNFYSGGGGGFELKALKFRRGFASYDIQMTLADEVVPGEFRTVFVKACTEEQIEKKAPQYQPEKVRCEMKRIQKVEGQQYKTVTTIKAADGEQKDSRSLELGEYSFSYMIEYFEDAGQNGVSVVIFENNQLMSEVGQFDCHLDLSRQYEDPFCIEEIQNFEGEPTFELSCEALY